MKSGRVAGQATQEFQRHDDADVVWRLYYAARATDIETYRSRVHSSYTEGFRRLCLPADRLPAPHELNGALAGSGWQVVLVPGYISVKHLAALLKQRCFPVARLVRSMAQIDHSPIPDALHDIVGHLPVLFHEPFTDFVLAWAELVTLAPEQLDAGFIHELQERLGYLESKQAAEVLHTPLRRQIDRLQRDIGTHPPGLLMLSRMYLWTVEFGLLQEDDTPRIFGAGILSSGQEMSNVLDGHTLVEPLGPGACCEDIDFTGFQRRIYVASSLAQWREALQTASRNGSS